ncbi:MAG: YigZ family protein [Ferruginibacter sp.]|nr:YigZ family protein [Ferruginibacter sp.]
MDHYLTIELEGEAVYTDRGSKFISYGFPVNSIDEFKKRLAQIKKEHPKAVHHCFAYRLGLTGDLYRANDDGEPSGTAGKQILGQIDSRQLINIGVIVVRYFGGTLLGVPGLIKAYKTSASLVLQTIPIINKAVEIQLIIHFPYERLGHVLKIVKYLGATILERGDGLFPYLKVNIAAGRADEFFEKIEGIEQVEVKKIVTL